MVPGLTIGGLFALTRRAAREVRLEELRNQTYERQALLRERENQDRSLSRMRAISSAQLSGTLMDRGISPMAFAGMGMDPDDPTTSAFVSQAASSGNRG